MTGKWRNQSHLVVKILPDGRNVELTRPFIMHRVHKRRVVEIITVPEGVMTNFASMPLLLWWLIAPTGLYNFATVIHDWLYEHQCLPRKQADRIFRDIMACMDVKPWKVVVMYRGVRSTGWWQWWRLRRARRDDVPWDEERPASPMGLT